MTKPIGTRTRVLIVDDDTGFSAFVGSFLDSANYEVDTARDLKAATETVRRADSPYDYALIDLWLPQSRASHHGAQPYLGVQLAAFIHSVSPATQIIGMSQFASKESALEATGRFSAYLNKSEVTNAPHATLSQFFRIKSQLQRNRRRSSLPLRISSNWIAVALIAATVSGVLTALFLLVPNAVVRTSLGVACAVFIILVVAHPERRYLRAFWIVLGIWSTATAIPTIGITIASDDFILKTFAEGPPTSFHLLSITLMALLVGFDFAIGRKASKAMNAEPPTMPFRNG